MEIKKNIFLSNTIEVSPFKCKNSFPHNSIPKREAKEHSEKILTKIINCLKENEKLCENTLIPCKKGAYLEFSSENNFPLKYESLEDRKGGIRLLNVQENSDKTVTKATIFIPEKKEKILVTKIKDYGSKITNTKVPKNNCLVASIEDLKLADISSFWIGDKNEIPNKYPKWCEIWLRYEYNNKLINSYVQTENIFLSTCKNLSIKVDDNLIVFPERIVKLALLTGEQLDNLIFGCPYIAEIKPASVTNYFFYNLDHKGQLEWCDDLSDRTNYEDNNVSVCLIDTGIASEHPLLKESIQKDGLHTIKEGWGLGDTGYRGDYHGTLMAGIALYFDLKRALLSPSNIVLKHKLESVKILPPNDDNDPKLYGALTKQAVALAEIANPKLKRAICMAITEDLTNGNPSSWSAAIDSLISSAEEEGNKRLFFVSAGNIHLNEIKDYPISNFEHSVKSPGQAWNAITVGAYSNDIIITDPKFKDFSPVAKTKELSPYSSTSYKWDSKWPIKPEILLDGGNVATNGYDFTNLEEYSLLTTNSKFNNNLFSNIDGTSSATAQASWMASQIMALYPNAWPETIRALLIHSATWSEEMIKQFCINDTKSKGRKDLLRACGYGIPNLKNAIQCLNNRVNLVIEGELKPFNEESMNEMHFS